MHVNFTKNYAKYLGGAIYFAEPRTIVVSVEFSIVFSCSIHVLSDSSARMRSEGYCSCVCVSVCLLSHISPMERLLVPKTLLRTQRPRIFVIICLKRLRSRVML